MVIEGDLALCCAGPSPLFFIFLAEAELVGEVGVEIFIGIC